jgi:glycerol-1-phosphate dehydrogenase [NAD(P)+]
MPGRKSQLDAIIGSAVARSSDIDAVVVEAGAIRHVPTLLNRHFGNKAAFVIADENTMEAAGHAVLAVLAAAGVATHRHVFAGTPRLKGSVENGNALKAVLAASDAVPLAVGAGVINDLAKYAAFGLGRPYFCVATAASMDGYASAGSPLVDGGFKHTIPCRPPRVMLADLDVIAAAPIEMTGWGYADLAGKLPAGADWIIADAIGIEPIDDVAWPLVQDGLRGWLSDPERLHRGDGGATAALFAGLVASGLAMEFHGSSRPASGADHQIAHLWEMEGIERLGVPVSHGECVAIGALTVLSLFDWLLTQDFTRIDVDGLVHRRETPDVIRREVDRHLSGVVAGYPSANDTIKERALAEMLAKVPEADALRRRLEVIRATWPALRDRLGDFLLPEAEMRRLLVEAGVATEPAALGISPAAHRETILRARLIRRRYTILDFLHDTGKLKDAVDALFSVGGRWAPS